jgi:hypothetical protein
MGPALTLLDMSLSEKLFQIPEYQLFDRQGQNEVWELVNAPFETYKRLLYEHRGGSMFSTWNIYAPTPELTRLYEVLKRSRFQTVNPFIKLRQKIVDELYRTVPITFGLSNATLH